ncbi:DinB family protein [Psychroserpens sp.]|uniref:DinB family protein n=1 Tax=Psychroserpens sp. TaxID=2020870 RepID=UPI001B134861|nr:DinB family protein [Psychroserpens sp.]MBO6607343.1 DinB family protein [Psychroserpens sp.]MBO6630801.1 DinB family protein [Psychroserpens sp.]MBO6654581.1 DinB family protein [Psychroserpens sp.]MBO6681072.1 DinB family protein [Psychroserpens sp.]MBO6749973.1 DinB family protein [Psychroserpens sp.]
MLTETLIAFFDRDLNNLKTEILSYTDENDLWLTSHDISNSAGNLSLHIVGNLNHFVGAVIGKTGYIRQRDLEFSQKHVPREELIKQIDDTFEMLTSVISNLTVEQLDSEYPKQVFGKPMRTEYFLIHLCTHLTYHLGQINYHRRLLIND